MRTRRILLRLAGAVAMTALAGLAPPSRAALVETLTASDLALAPGQFGSSAGLEEWRIELPFAFDALSTGDELRVDVDFAPGHRITVSSAGGSNDVIVFLALFPDDIHLNVWDGLPLYEFAATFTGVEGSLVGNGLAATASGASGGIHVSNRASTPTSFSFSDLHFEATALRDLPFTQFRDARLVVRAEDVSATVVPAPAAAALLPVSLGVLALLGRRRRRAAV